MPSKPKTRSPVAYREVSTKAWAEAVSRTFTYRVIDDGYYYHGICPRCHHETGMDITQHHEVIQTITIEDHLPGPVSIEQLTVHCRCLVQHAKDKKGCGAFGNVLGLKFIP